MEGEGGAVYSSPFAIFGGCSYDCADLLFADSTTDEEIRTDARSLYSLKQDVADLLEKGGMEDMERMEFPPASCGVCELPKNPQCWGIYEGMCEDCEQMRWDALPWHRKAFCHIRDYAGIPVALLTIYFSPYIFGIPALLHIFWEPRKEATLAG